MFPAFRQFGYSSITLAKSGNAILKFWAQIWLLEATQDDTVSTVTQIEEFKSFIVQATTSSGRGLSSLTCDRADRSTQIFTMKTYVAEFINKHAQQEVAKENNNPQVFLQASGVRHRPLKRKSIEGAFVNNKLKKGRANVYQTMQPGFGRQLQETKSILAEENADVPIDNSPPCGLDPTKEKFPEVVLLAA